jgi:hypothetical protein
MTRITRFFLMKSLSKNVLSAVLALFLVQAGFAITTSAKQVADVTIVEGGILVTASIPGATFMMLRIADPQGQIIFDQSSDGGPITWFLPDGVQDGTYSYEVRVGVAKRREERGESQQPEPPARRLIQSGTVFIQGGAIVPPNEKEASLFDDISTIAKVAFAKLMDFLVSPAFADILHYDDVIITGSECVGFDCADGESFGFDTIKLKEHNLRIYFEDTSYTPGYSTNDWRIVINDSTNGGASYFAIQDATGGTTPFEIEAGAPNSSLHVDDYGRLGVGTSLPVVEVHTLDGDTPTLRLDQDSSSGWTAQTWDVAGNESNFFIRDATNGSKLPFRIQPNTPSSTLCLNNGGKVGIGTWSPAAKLELETTGEDSDFLLQRTDGVEGVLSAKVDAFIVGSKSNAILDFVINASPMMTIDTGGNVGIGTRLPLERLHVVGNAFVSGNLELGSSREYKENIQPLEEQQAMDTLKALRPVRFNYKIDPTEESVGFIAEEVPELVATESRKTLSTMDIVAVLTKVIQEQQRAIEELSRKVVDLEREVGATSRGDSLD